MGTWYVCGLMVTEVGFEFRDQSSNPLCDISWLAALGKSSTLYRSLDADLLLD